MRKLLFGVVSLLLAFQGFSQSDQPLNLKWKIDKEKPLIYKTYMELLEAPNLKLNLDEWFGPDTNKNAPSNDEIAKTLKKLNESLNDDKTETKLTNKGNGIIDIVMYIEEEEKITEEEVMKLDSLDMDSAGVNKMLARMMSTMNNGVRLRGSVYEDGGIHSFWIKSSQKNLISLLFELPRQKVKVGDNWSIELNFIGNDQNFECDSSYRKNNVSLSEIKEKGDERIAVITYDITEYVIGDFTSPSFFSSKPSTSETMMEFYYKGIGEFSIDKGKWISYEGIMGYISSGVMTGNSKTKFSLVEK